MRCNEKKREINQEKNEDDDAKTRAYDVLNHQKRKRNTLKIPRFGGRKRCSPDGDAEAESVADSSFFFSSVGEVFFFDKKE